MNSSSALVTAAFFVFSPLSLNAFSNKAGSIAKFVAMCEPPHIMLNRNTAAVKKQDKNRYCSIACRGPVSATGTMSPFEIHDLDDAEITREKPAMT